MRRRRRLAIELRRAEKKMLQAAINTSLQWKKDEHDKVEKAAAATAAAAATTAAAQ